MRRTSPGTNNWVDPFGNQRLNYGNSSQNVRNRAVGWANLNVPGLKGNGPLTYLTNGWSIKPYVQVQNGLPYSLLTSGTAPQQCADPGCLQAASSGITGTGATAYLPFFGRNTLQYPRTIEIDLRAQKAFKIMEKYNLEIFGEAFNLANHQNVTGVNTSGYAIIRRRWCRHVDVPVELRPDFVGEHELRLRTTRCSDWRSRQLLTAVDSLEGGGFGCRPFLFKSRV